MNLDIKETGQRVKEVRKQQNLTQERLAELIEVSPHYIYEIEKGLKCMSINVLSSISTHLEVSSDYLLFGTTLLERDVPSSTDRLELITKQLNQKQRDHVADILSVMVPWLK